MLEERTLFIECKDIVLNVSQTIDELQDYFIHKDSSLNAYQIDEKVEEYLLNYPNKIKISDDFKEILLDLKKRFNIVLIDVVASEPQYAHLKYLAKYFDVDFLAIGVGAYENGQHFTVGDGYLLCSSLSLAYGTDAKKIFYKPTNFYNRLNGYLFKHVIPVKSWNSFLKKVVYNHG